MRIKEVEQKTGLSAKTIRYYERRKLITVPRSNNSYREYDSQIVNTLLSIKQMRLLGIPCSDIKLWADRVITAEELLEKRKKEIEFEEAANKQRQYLCSALLSGDFSGCMQQPFSESMETLEARDRWDSSLVLGIDIGTTTISAQLIEVDTRKSLQSYSIEHHAQLQADGYADAYAQNADLLLSSTTALIDSLINTYPNILSIGLTGQMHGIVCLDRNGSCISPLYSWQNKFGMRKIGRQTITDSITKLTGEPVPSGYGINTCYALKQFGMLPKGTVKIATIMDVLAARLCCSEEIITHPTNAAGLGLFNSANLIFLSSKFSVLGLPSDIVPTVKEGFFTVGKYRGIPVALPIGDNQAGVFASLTSSSQVLINVGTSSQITMIDKKFVPQNGSIETRPFISGKYIKVGSALCGGSAYAALADFVAGVLKEFGVNIRRKEIDTRLNRLSIEELPFPLKIDTCFLGSRDDPEKKAQISGLGFENFDLAHLTQGIMYGIVDELYGMYRQMKDSSNYIPVISGNAMRKSPALRAITEKVFGKPPLLLCCPEEAAYGAALYGAVSAGVIEEKAVSRFIVYERS